LLANSNPAYLLASHDPELLARVRRAVSASGARVEVFLSAEPVLSALTAAHPMELALLDATLPNVDWGGFLAALHSDSNAKRVPIVVLTPNADEEWGNRFTEGVIDDLLPIDIGEEFLRLRLDAVLRSHKISMELEMMREAAVLTSQVDRLTGVYNRETLLSMLHRETDRSQRLKSSLCMILFDIDDFGHWNTRLGAEICDDLLGQVASRAARLLRSYDLIGRVGKDEFLIGLPGCSEVNAVLLAERMRYEIFSVPFQVNEEAIRLSACFGVTSSQGRDPMVVLREAEEALVCAKEAGPETIHCAGDASHSSTSSIPFAPPGAGDQLFAW
jgi:two-component system cell cycle response regulator